MISIEKLRAVKHVCTHAACPDGYASALILKDALPNVKVSFMAYGTKEHRDLDPAPGVLFCDFTPWLPKLTDSRAQIVCEDGRTASITDKGVLALREDLIAKWREAGVLVLDHHPTARDIVEAFGENGVFGENDKNECGAWLAYTEVWMPLRSVEQGPTDVGHFARLAAIRDTWKKSDPCWKEACEQAAMLLFWPFEGLNLQRVFSSSDADVGSVLVAKQLSAAQRSIDEAHRFRTSKGTSVQMFQGVSTTSDAAEILEQHGARLGLVVGFHYRVDPTWDTADLVDQTKLNKLQLQFSMRSHTGYDCAAFAKHHGGGGHKAAAGFTVEVSPEISVNPYAMFRLLLEEFEG